MNDLIWFSIPGAILLVALKLAFPSLLPPEPVLIVGSAPVLGFIFHQLFRTIFEILGGWQMSGRIVLDEIQQAYSLPQEDRLNAFLIWETTFYSDSIPETFRAHNRGAWHYIMSFWSIALAAGVSGLLMCGSGQFVAGAKIDWFSTSIFALVAIVFAIKGHLTFASIANQERAGFLRFREGFDKTNSTLNHIPKR